MSDFFTAEPSGKVTVITFQTETLMNAHDLDQIGAEIYGLIEDGHHSQILINFEKVMYVSSQAIGIIMAVRKKLAVIPKSRLVLCQVGPSVVQLLKITGLEKLLTIKPTTKDGLKVFE